MAVDRTTTVRGVIDRQLAEEPEPITLPTVAYSIRPARMRLHVTAPAGTATLTSTPTVQAGELNGQILKIMNASDAGTIIFQDEDTLTGSNLQLQTPTVALEYRETLVLMWDGTYWIEVDRATGAGASATEILAEDYGAVGDGSTDDAEAIQAALDAAFEANLPLRLLCKDYKVNTEIQWPDGLTTIIGTRGTGDVAVSTLKAGAAMRAVLNFEPFGGSAVSADITNLSLNGNRLADYSMRLHGCSYSQFKNITVGLPLEDGVRLVNLDSSINDQNTWYNFSSGSSGTLFLTQDLVDDEDSLYGSCAPVRSITAGTCEVVSGDNTVTFTGAPNLTTIGVAVGDPIRTGTSTNKRFGVITAVTDATHLEVQFDTSDGLSDVSASGQDWAMARGDGYHDERSGDNNRATFIGGGLHRANAGFAFVFDGLYGPQIANQLVIDFHPFWAIRVGTSGGDPVITPVFDSMYFESLGTTKPFLLRSTTSIEVRNPLDSEGDDTDNVSYCGSQANVSGTYMNRNGIFYLGSNAFESHLAAVNVGALFGGGASINGPMKFTSGTATVTAGVVTRGNSSVAGSALILVDSTGNPTVSDIAVFGSELLMLGVSGGGTVTLQASSTLHLSTSTYAMTAANGNTITLVYINSAWHEISRATADKTS